MRHLAFIILLICCLKAGSQTIGGRSAFNFLNIPTDPLLTGAGNINASYSVNEVGLTANNPSLLNVQASTQFQVSFSSYFKGIKSYSATGAYYDVKTKTTFGGHVNLIDYGSIIETDASGLSYGQFRPKDFVIQLEAARSYLENWSYGVSLKFINSIYGQYKANAIALDVGVLFSDSLHNFSASILAKNMGFQITSFSGEKEDLPFDLQIGITKKLQNAPLGISLTAYHLNKFDLVYSDSVYNNVNEYQNHQSSVNKILNHFVIAGHIFIGKNLEAILGYNHLKRMELNMGLSNNGLNGFSTGIRLLYQNLQVLYARSNYQKSIALNQIGINLKLNTFYSSGRL